MLTVEGNFREKYFNNENRKKNHIGIPNENVLINIDANFQERIEASFFIGRYYRPMAFFDSMIPCRGREESSRSGKDS